MRFEDNENSLGEEEGGEVEAYGASVGVDALRDGSVCGGKLPFEGKPAEGSVRSQYRQSRRWEGMADLQLWMPDLHLLWSL